MGMEGGENTTEIKGTDVLLIRKDNKACHKYEFDAVLPPESTQIEVFRYVEELITSLLDGYNICLFAYGQTGSGKTYTMEGDTSNVDGYGVSMRSILLLFELMSRHVDRLYVVTMSSLEIYNESIYDLMTDSNNSKQREALDIRQSSEGNVVVGLTEHIVSHS